jgi:hypothetical protein
MYDWQLEALPTSKQHTMRLCYLNPKHFPNGGLFFNDIDLFRQTHGESVPVIVHANYMKVSSPFPSPLEPVRCSV